jgi:hypothetical protein
MGRASGRKKKKKQPHRGRWAQLTQQQAHEFLRLVHDAPAARFDRIDLSRTATWSAFDKMECTRRTVRGLSVCPSAL